MSSTEVELIDARLYSDALALVKCVVDWKADGISDQQCASHVARRHLLPLVEKIRAEATCSDEKERAP